MADISRRKRIWGWYFYDWASQPYSTLLLTFIFGPYIKELIGDGAEAQSAWGYSVGFAGLLIAFSAPFLGAMADKGGHRIAWIAVFSVLYVMGASGTWLADPGGFNLYLVLALFAVGLVGLEFSTIFTNSLLPDLGTRDEIGKLSGDGSAFGYIGGLLALLIMLFLFAEDSSGMTRLGGPPLLGLNPEAREGTRFVGPFTALWYVVFMIPFFLWVREPKGKASEPLMQAAREAWPELRKTIVNLPKTPSLFAYLGSSMFYRDALNGLYTFGAIYAAGVLGWNIGQIGTFAILAIFTAALFSWLGGRADARFGPKPVLVICVILLTIICAGVTFIARDSVFGIAVDPNSSAPDAAFYVLGAAIGSAGGALQAASRTMMVRHADPEAPTEAFGLYALAGKATAFLAPLSVGIATDISGSQQMGIIPLIVLFLIALVLLTRVKPEGERAVCPGIEPSSPRA